MKLTLPTGITIQTESIAETTYVLREISKALGLEPELKIVAPRQRGRRAKKRPATASDRLVVLVSSVRGLIAKGSTGAL